MKTLVRIQAMTFKEIRQLSRDRLTFGMIVMIPLIQLLLFGFAINTNVRHIPVAVVDQSHDQTGRFIIEAVKATQVITFTQRFATPDEAKSAIQAGEVRAALFIPADVNQRLLQGKTLGQWMVDGTDSVIGNAIKGLQGLPFTLNNKLNNGVQSSSDTQTFDVALYYNPSGRTALNIVPGLLGVILTMTMVLFTSIAIVDQYTGQTLRADDCQNNTLYFCRLAPSGDCIGVRPSVISRSYSRQLSRYFYGVTAFYFGEFNLGIADFNGGTNPITSDADDNVCFVAVYFAVWVYVSLRRHASGRAVYFRSFSRYAFYAFNSRFGTS